LDVVADVRALAAVRIRQTAFVFEVLEGERTVPGALRGEHRDPELADRAGLAELVVVLVERPVRAGKHRLPGQRRLQRAKVHRAAEGAGLRAEADARSGEQIGVDA